MKIIDNSKGNLPNFKAIQRKFYPARWHLAGSVMDSQRRLVYPAEFASETSAVGGWNSMEFIYLFQLYMMHSLCCLNILEKNNWGQGAWLAISSQ